MSSTTVAPAYDASTKSDRRLRYAAVFFAVAVLIHNSDHVRRGIDATPKDVFWLGTSAIILEVGVVALVIGRSRIAPLAAVAVGFPLAAGYVFVHFTPERGWISDSLSTGEGVTALSWFAASLEVAAALSLAVAGLRVLRQRGLASASSRAATKDPVLDTRVFFHPVVAAMAAGNIVILAVSFTELLR